MGNGEIQILLYQRWLKFQTHNLALLGLLTLSSFLSGKERRARLIKIATLFWLVFVKHLDHTPIIWRSICTSTLWPYPESAWTLKNMRRRNRDIICRVLPVWFLPAIDPDLSIHGWPDKYLDTLIRVISALDQSRSITWGSFLPRIHPSFKLSWWWSRPLGGSSYLEMAPHLLKWLNHFVKGEVLWSTCGLYGLHLRF